MSKSVTRKIVVAGVMSAISVLLGATHWGFIPWLAGAALTIMHVPVIIGAVLEGPVVGLVIGFIFGLFSLLQGAIAPTEPADTWFVNPLLSILPRLFIGPVAWLVYRLLQRAGKEAALISGGLGLGLVAALGYMIGESNAPAGLVVAGLGLGLVAALVYQSFSQDPETMAASMAGVIGSLTNTALVLGMIGLLGFLPWGAIAPIAVANGLPEAIVSAIVTLAVVAAWKGLDTRRGKSRL